MTSHEPAALDAVVVGSGPNGLAAALTLARAGLRVEVFEGASTFGGGCRTEELTIPGFSHDVCSTVQSMVPLSPFFAGIDVADLGVNLMTPDIAFAHPLDAGRGAHVGGLVAETAKALGTDGYAYRRLFGPLVDDANSLVSAVLSPLRSIPTSPITMARFAYAGLASAERLVRRFETDEARALLGGVSAHSMLALDAPLTSAFGIFLTVTAHVGGWPVVEGGSAQLVEGLVHALEAEGVVLHSDRWIRRSDDLPRARAMVFDTSPEALVEIMGDQIPGSYRRAVSRFRHGPGVCKVDFALEGPVPWIDNVCRRSATVHVGGAFEEIAEAEADVAAGRHAERPFCIVVQPGVIDPSRAPSRRATLWSYCHVPNGSTIDMSTRIEQQIERFAPGFRDLVLAKSVITAADAARANPNYVGGDINGGAGTLRQTLFRPAVRWNPYRTGAPGVYLCSASTPPGGGVHGMCGVGAARAVLDDLR